MEEVATVVAGLGFGDLAALAPEVALADVVVIGNGDARALAEDVAEGEAELEPGGSVLFVVVGLVAGKEDKVGILVVDVADIFGAQAAVLVRVAGKGGDDDFLLGPRVFADESLEGGFLTVEKPVFDIFGVIPVGDAEAGGPTEVVDLLACDFGPGTVFFELLAGPRGFPWERADRAAR